MIRLFQFAPALGLPNASPFCMKLETYLRMTGIPYENVYIGNPRKGPKGKLPFIEHEGRRLGDSGFIIEYLKSRFGDPLDQGLSSEQRAQALALRRMVEEDLYWALLYSRWVEEAGWAVMRKAFFGGLPFPLGAIVPPLVRRSMARAIHMQGTGRHSAQEIYVNGTADVTALADFLGGKPYLLGDRPTTLDATAFAFLANILWVALETPLRNCARARANLGAYCERMWRRYYPEQDMPALE